MGGKERGREGEERGGEVAPPLSQIPGSAPDRDKTVVKYCLHCRHL